MGHGRIVFDKDCARDALWTLESGLISDTYMSQELYGIVVPKFCRHVCSKCFFRVTRSVKFKFQSESAR